VPHRLKGPQPEIELLGGMSDRIEQCEADLEPLLLQLMDKAIAAGWNRAEAAIAVTSLADNYLLCQISIDDTRKRISAAVENARRPGSSAR